MLNWTDADSEDTPLELARDLGRGKPAHRGDVMAAADALDEAGVYDKSRFGNPPLADEHLFKAIERFQDDQGLEVDGLMRPGGPTVTRLNAVLGRRARGDDADAAPIAAPAPAPDDGDGPRFVDLFRARRDAGAPEGFGPAFDIFEPQGDVPAPQLAQANRNQRRQRRPQIQERQEPEEQMLDRPPYLPQIGPPWLLPQSRMGRRGDGVPGRDDFWQYLQGRNDLSPAERIAYQIMFDWEGGRQYGRNSDGGEDRSVFAGIRQSPLDSLSGHNPRVPHLGYADLEELGPDGRIRPRTIGPGVNNGDLVRVYRGLLDDVILPGSTFRDPFHPEVGRGRRNADDGQRGIAAIEALRDPALTVVIADTLLRWGGPDGTRDIQNAVRAVVRSGRAQAVRDTPQPNESETARRQRDRDDPMYVDLDALANRRADGAFGSATYGAIAELVRLGQGDRLREAILDGYGRSHLNGRRMERGDRERIEWLRRFNPPTQ